MTGTPAHSHDHDRRGAFLRRTATLIAVSLALALLVAGCLRRERLHRGGGRQAKPLEKKYVLENELTLKADLAAKLPYAPKVIVLGRFAVAALRTRVHRKEDRSRAFNAGVRERPSGRGLGPPHYLHGLWPEAGPATCGSSTSSCFAAGGACSRRWSRTSASAATSRSRSSTSR